MKNRWYICILIVTLTLLGSFASKDQASVPNQEIVLQFTSQAVTSNETCHAIALVKQKLQAADVKNIKVQKQRNGHLKITYFSTADVTIIKALLSQGEALSVDYLSNGERQRHIPSEDESITYNLDVYEIQQGNDISDLDGKLALETKPETNRFANPYVFIASEEMHIDAKERIEKVAYKFRRDIEITIDNHSYKIPEVRAGPVHYGIFYCS